MKKYFEQVKLFPWQDQIERAYEAGAKYVLIKAGRKAGKSVYARWRLVNSCLKPAIVDNQTNCYIAPEKSHAKKIMWGPLKKYVWDNGQVQDLLVKKPNETELYMDFKDTGIQLSLEGAENEDAIRGRNMGFSVLDECDMFKNPQFFHEVLEPNFLITKPEALFISTPKNRWFTKMWKQAKEGRLGRQWVAFKFTSFDNPVIGKEELDRIKDSIPDHIWEQEYMANEYANSGLKYTEFDPTQHIVKHRAPTGPRFARFMDWGFDHPSFCLWAELFFNQTTQRWNMYIFREFSVRGKNVEELCGIIRAGDPNRYLFNVIDKSSKRTEIGTGKPIMTEFFKHGLPCFLPPHKKDYWTNSLKMMLKKGDIQISEECRTLIKQLDEVEWETKEGDDALDALEYGAAYVYERDLSLMEIPQMPKPQETIDPNGLLAPQNNSGSWDVVNF